MRLVALASLLVCAACTRSAAPAQPRVRPVLTTIAETSGYLRTGRYDETLRLCRDFARVYPGVHCEEIGTTLQGRPIVALRIQRRANTPTILIQAGIHAGEIEGKDAGFWFLRDLLDGTIAPGALDQVSIVFVPVMNPDGHELVAPNHRPNQRGPEEMGFRTNGARLNLNRDYVKADAPETQAVLGVIAKYDPVLFVDLHTTDGAKFEHDIAVIKAPEAPRTDGLDEVAGALETSLIQRLTALGHLPLDFYPSFVDEANPASGFARGEAPPRFGHFYMAARSRLGVLIETHSWRTYKERAASTYHALQAIFEEATRSAPVWASITRAADLADAHLAGTKVPLMWTAGTHTRDLAFRGYAYEKRTSDLTGGPWLVYDETKPAIWTVPLYDRLTPAITIEAPRGGYIVDGGFARLVAALLDRHGITYAPIAPDTKLAVEVFRATSTTLQPLYEGRTRVAITGAWARETRTIDRGAIFIPMRQPRARLILHLFEPSLPDSLAQWGMFNAVFERKEYIEPYVLETAARELLAKDPALRAQYDAYLASDPKLTTAQKLDFFYRRHPAWDERVDLLPVYRSDRVLEVRAIERISTPR